MKEAIIVRKEASARMADRRRYGGEDFHDSASTRRQRSPSLSKALAGRMVPPGWSSVMVNGDMEL